MPLYVYRGNDGPQGAELRKQLRERHLAHLEALTQAGRIHFAEIGRASCRERV